MRNIEVEVRSFITKNQYRNLLKLLKKEGKFLGEDNQITYYFELGEKQGSRRRRGFYFSGIPDLRIQKNKNFAKIWLKKGKIHDRFREEIEVKFDRKDFEKLKNIFLALGFKKEIVWLRKRNEFLWKGINVFLDFTKGYGFIVELEETLRQAQGKLDKTKEEIYQSLTQKLEKLGVGITPKRIFEEKFDYYKRNWRKILKNENQK